MNLLNKINEILNEINGLEIERVSELNSIQKEALKGYKYILRGGGLNEDFKTFKDVKKFIETL